MAIIIFFGICLLYVISVILLENKKTLSQLLGIILFIVLVICAFHMLKSANTIGGKLYDPPSYKSVIQELQIINYLDEEVPTINLYKKQREKYYKIINTYYKSRFKRENPDISGQAFRNRIRKADQRFIKCCEESLKDIQETGKIRDETLDKYFK